MSLWKLVKKSIGFYWRTNVGVFLAVLVSAAVLTGGLLVGDSVRYSLRRLVTARLGQVERAIVGGERFFRRQLADDLSRKFRKAGAAVDSAAVLSLRGLIADSEGARRVNQVEVLGVDERFYDVGGGRNPFGKDFGEGVVLNKPLAERLGAGVGDEVVLRIDKPGVMPRDAALGLDFDLSVGFRLTVKAIAGEDEFGRFSLAANQVSPMNVFLPIEQLGEKIGREGLANMLLVKGRGVFAEALNKSLRLADVGLELRQLDEQGVFEVRSRRVFIDDYLGRAAHGAADESVGVLTYFVNELRAGERATPYSVVAAVEPSGESGGLIAADMADDEIVVNRWLADDLGVKVGDEIALKYFVAGPMRKLIERESNFVVRSIVAIDGAAADGELMPAYPGLADVENCRDWRLGIDIDLKKIRDKDEEYWDMYRGTPKGFITLRAGQRIWDNRFGKLTAVRYPVKGNTAESITRSVLSSIDAGGAGLYFQPVLEAGLKAGGEGSDFGQLFLGLSMFLIMAAVILVGLVFVFGVEKRSSEAGLLLAVGFSRRVVKTVFLLEGAVLAVVGGLVGAVAGVGYTWAMIYGLGTVWADAVSGSPIQFFARPVTVLIGWWAAAGVSLIAIWFGLHRQLRQSSRQLLEPVAEGQFLSISKGSKGRGGFCVAAIAVIGAGAILWFMGGEGAAGAFFGAGALLLVGEVGFAHGLLGMIVSKWGPVVKSVAGLGLRNVVRRSGRSLAVVGLLACGVFMVIGVGANHKNPMANADRRDSGTGGFGLFGQSAIGVLHDLNTQDGLREFGLDEEEMTGVDVVGLRVRQGDDASCLNLNRAQRPRLLGVQAEQLKSRRAFRFIKTIENEANEKGWGLVDIELSDGVIPAVGDYATVYWALGKRVGDEIEYIDERGGRFKVRIVGMLENSILQGSLVISEKNFIERFGSVAGHRMFLIDAPAERVAKVSDQLSGALRDYGMDIVPTGRRLAMFSVVEHTYLKIFLLLGGLGLVLGTVGLGLVVLRNVLDRRGELGMLRAVGFDRVTLKRMVLYEHAGLLVAGLLFGIVAAAVAVGPVLKTPSGSVPYGWLMITIVCIAGSGVLWIWTATAIALGGNLLEAVRNE